MKRLSIVVGFCLALTAFSAAADNSDAPSSYSDLIRNQSVVASLGNSLLGESVDSTLVKQILQLLTSAFQAISLCHST